MITSGAPDHPAEYDEPNGGTPNERCKYLVQYNIQCQPSMLLIRLEEYLSTGGLLDK